MENKLNKNKHVYRIHDKDCISRWACVFNNIKMFSSGFIWLYTHPVCSECETAVQRLTRSSDWPRFESVCHDKHNYYYQMWITWLKWCISGFKTHTHTLSHTHTHTYTHRETHSMFCRDEGRIKMAMGWSCAACNLLTAFAETSKIQCFPCWKHTHTRLMSLPHPSVCLFMRLSVCLSPVRPPVWRSGRWFRTGGCCTVRPRWTGDSECLSPSVPVTTQSGSRVRPSRTRASAASCLSNTGSVTNESLCSEYNQIKHSTESFIRVFIILCRFCLYYSIWCLKLCITRTWEVNEIKLNWIWFIIEKLYNIDSYWNKFNSV